MDLQIKLLAKRGSAQRRGEPKRKEEKISLRLCSYFNERRSELISSVSSRKTVSFYHPFLHLGPRNNYYVVRSLPETGAIDNAVFNIF